MYLVRTAILFLGLFSYFLSWAQEEKFTLNGKVIDEGGEPMIGTTILINGKNKGTISDVEGNFKLEVSEGIKLTISHVGFQAQELIIGTATSITITLRPDIYNLDDLVVIGYGTRRKKDVTGAVSKLTNKEFNGGIIASPDQLIQGKMAGVDVIRSSGEPGAIFTVRIRGASTIRAGNNPLYVIDGYPLDINFTYSPNKDPLTFLNPDDIKSIEVLKDASASAIYGARGANGVILITTKTGSVGKARISYSTYGSISELREKIDLASPKEFKEAQLLYGFSGKDFGGSTDWHDEIFRTAFTHNHDLSVSGGGPSTDYRVSINFLDQEGIIETSELQRFAGRTNLHQDAIHGKLSLDLFLTLSRIQERNPPSGIAGGVTTNPTWPIFDQNGNYFQSGQAFNNIHPTARIDLLHDETTTNRLLSNLTASLQLLEDLQFKINAGGDISTATRRTNESSLLATFNNGLATIGERELGSALFESYLTYNKVLGSQHRFSIMAGYSYQEFRVEEFLFSRGDFATDEILGVDNIAVGTTDETAESGKEKSALQSFFGRLDYAFREKYLLTMNFRRDGSTRFGENNKYGDFPSFAAAWLLTEEPFIANTGIIDVLKLRFSWGLTGNQELPNKISQTILGAPIDAAFILDNSGRPIQGFTFVRTPNPDLKWEETRQIDVGVEFSLFKYRLNGRIDYFNKSTTDLLLEIPAVAAPTTLAWTNLDAEVTNRGWEFELSVVPVTGEGFHWETSINFTTINNEVNGLITPLSTKLEIGEQVVTNGLPLGTFFGPKWLAFDDNGIDVFRTDSEGNMLEEPLGSALPDFTWGITNTIKYGKFDLTFLINGSQGNRMYSNFLHRNMDKQGFRQFGGNSTLDIINSEENFTNANLFSSRHVINGSYTRLNYLTLGYSFETREISWLDKVRIYFTGSNLFLITEFEGFDPEVNSNPGTPFDTDIDRFKRPTTIPPIGVESNSYPGARTFQFGFQVSFL